MSANTADALAGARPLRDGDEWFVVSRASDVTRTCVGAAAERVVELWHALSEHLDPAVDVRVDDVRTGRSWAGPLLALPDVRDALGRLRLPLAAYGGVEISVFTDVDQLTLTPELLLVIYCRTDRWAFLLDGLGISERPTWPAPAYRPVRARLRPESQLEEALQATAVRLALHEVTG